MITVRRAGVSRSAIGFDGCERAYAEAVVAYTGTGAEYGAVDDVSALGEIERVIFDLEGLYFTPLVGPWAAYRAMRRAEVPALPCLL